MMMCMRTKIPIEVLGHKVQIVSVHPAFPKLAVELEPQEPIGGTTRWVTFIPAEDYSKNGFIKAVKKQASKDLKLFLAKEKGKEIIRREQEKLEKLAKKLDEKFFGKDYGGRRPW